MQTDSIELLGLLAGFIGAFAYAPQALKIWRDKSARDVSALSYSMVLAGNILWIGYGALRGAPSIMIWNVVAAAIATFVLTLKVTTRAA
ncbi:MAG TPA: SemiSWEET family transporter, partial [Caulobacterales bacterium]|nr:SemiSWEET family transporter [Caulobacterales bacterium]